MGNFDDAVTENRRVTTMLAKEMDITAQMHAVAQKYDFMLRCSRCQRPFQGFNDKGDHILTIECGCRVLRAPALNAIM